jgi:hypothetical protein
VRQELEWTQAIRMRLADAYAEQSRSDFAVYQIHLQGAEDCHRLHYLQMACEKIAKAYRLRDPVSFNPDDLYSHVVFSKFIVGYLKSTPIKLRYRLQDSKRRQMDRYAKLLATEIERLAPAVDRKNRPDNVEYPWLTGETIFVPCHHSYPISRLLGEQGGRDILKLIEIAIEDY